MRLRAPTVTGYDSTPHRSEQAVRLGAHGPLALRVFCLQFFVRLLERPCVVGALVTAHPGQEYRLRRRVALGIFLKQAVEMDKGIFEAVSVEIDLPHPQQQIGYELVGGEETDGTVM